MAAPRLYQAGDSVITAQPEGFPVAFRSSKEAEPSHDIHNGQELQVLEQESGDNWVKIALGDLTGWVKNRNVQPSPALLARLAEEVAEAQRQREAAEAEDRRLREAEAQAQRQREEEEAEERRLQEHAEAEERRLLAEAEAEAEAEAQRLREEAEAEECQLLTAAIPAEPAAVTLSQLGVAKGLVMQQADGYPQGVAVRDRPDGAVEPFGNVPNDTPVDWLSDDGVWTGVTVPGWEAEGRTAFVKRRNFQIPSQQLITQHADGPNAARDNDGVPCFAVLEDLDLDPPIPFHFIPNSQQVTVMELVGEHWRIEWRGALALKRGATMGYSGGKGGSADGKSGHEGYLGGKGGSADGKGGYGGGAAPGTQCVRGFVHWRHLRSPEIPRGAHARCVNEKCCCTASYNGLPNTFCCERCATQPCSENQHQMPDPAHQMIRDSWAPCKNPNCRCASSWNGAYGEHCCVECRDGTPCASNLHAIPTTPGVAPSGVRMELYHGTTRDRAELIKANGFRPSGAQELLGAGVYFVEFQDLEKAKRFAHDVGKRFESPTSGQLGDETLEPVILKCEVVVGNLKQVNGNDQGWEAQFYDACRTSKTTQSKTPEWCVTARSSIKILEVSSVKEIENRRCPFRNHHFPCWAQQMSKKCPCE